MRLSLSILGVFATIVCTEKSAEAGQNYPWTGHTPAVPLHNIGAMLGRSPRERRVLFTQSVPLVTRTRFGNQTPEALRLSQQLRQLGAGVKWATRADQIKQRRSNYRTELRRQDVPMGLR